MYNLQSTIYNLQYTIYNLQSIIYNLQSTIYNLHACSVKQSVPVSTNVASVYGGEVGKSSSYNAEKRIFFICKPQILALPLVGMIRSLFVYVTLRIFI